MSLQELISKKLSCLRPCETYITLPTGQVIKETNISSGKRSSAVVEIRAGYVIDNKPDMQVAFIVPGLCMGSQDVVVYPDVLKSHRITHILSLGVMPQVSVENICHLYIPLLDVPDANFDCALKQSLPFISEAMKNAGVVYVHCNAGISRSASVVIAYLIKEGMSFDEAYHLVKSKREIIKPNEGFLKYLKELESRKAGLQ